MEELCITVNAEILRNTVRKHKARFEKSYSTLLKAYEKSVIKYQKDYAEFTKNAIKGEVKSNDYGPYAPMKPENRTDIYDFYLKMLATHVDRFITISESSYRKLLLDKWDWTGSYIHTLANYSADSAEVAEALSWYSEDKEAV